MYLFFWPGGYDYQDVGNNGPMPTFRPKLVAGVQLFGMRIRDDICKYRFAIKKIVIIFYRRKLINYVNSPTFMLMSIQMINHQSLAGAILHILKLMYILRYCIIKVNC